MWVPAFFFKSHPVMSFKKSTFCMGNEKKKADKPRRTQAKYKD